MTDHWKDQPREPSGTPEGGRWTRAASSARQAAGLSEDTDAVRFARFVLEHRPGDELPQDLQAFDDQLMREGWEGSLGDWSRRTMHEYAIEETIKQSQGLLTDSDAEKLRELGINRPYIVIWTEPKNLDAYTENLAEWGYTSPHQIRPVGLQAVGWWEWRRDYWEIHIAKAEGHDPKATFWHELSHTLTDDVIKRIIGDKRPGETSGEWHDRFAERMLK